MLAGSADPVLSVAKAEATFDGANFEEPGCTGFSDTFNNGIYPGWTRIDVRTWSCSLLDESR